MTRTDPNQPRGGNKPAQKPSDPRLPHSIRFSGSEWNLIEKAAGLHGIPVGEHRLEGRPGSGRVAALADPDGGLRRFHTSALACAVGLASDTTGHDWYASGKLTWAETLLALGLGIM